MEADITRSSVNVEMLYSGVQTSALHTEIGFTLQGSIEAGGAAISLRLNLWAGVRSEQSKTSYLRSMRRKPHKKPASLAPKTALRRLVNLLHQAVRWTVFSRDPASHSITPTLMVRKRAGAAPWPVWPICIGWPLPQFGVPQMIQ